MTSHCRKSMRCCCWEAGSDVKEADNVDETPSYSTPPAGTSPYHAPLIHTATVSYQTSIKKCNKKKTSVLRAASYRRNVLVPTSTRPHQKLVRQMSAAVSDGDPQLLHNLLSSSTTELDQAILVTQAEILHCACATGNLATVAVLLRHGASINKVASGDSYDCAALHVAVKHQFLSVVSLLLSHGANVNTVTRYERRTPLHVAANTGNCDVIRLLVDNGARVDQGDIYGMTSLHVAARMGHLAAADTLLELSASSVNVYDNDGWTALHLATEVGNIAMVKLLVDRKAHTDCQTKFGRTPLHWACSRGHCQVVEFLLKHHASVTATDIFGRSAVDHASSDVIRNLLRAALNARNKTSAPPDGDTLLHNVTSSSKILADRSPRHHHIKTDVTTGCKPRDVGEPISDAPKISRDLKSTYESRSSTVIVHDTLHKTVSELMSETVRIRQLINMATVSNSNNGPDSSCGDNPVRPADIAANSHELQCSVHRLEQQLVNIQTVLDTHVSLVDKRPT